MERGRERDEHRQFEDMAVSHVLGGLSESGSRVFRAHLLDCPDCRARVGELRAIASDLADVERSERRERAAKVLETKNRDEDDEDDEDYSEGMSRRTRILLLGGLVGLMLLVSWNFVLRGQVAQLHELLEQRVAATAIVNLGTSWTVTHIAEGVTGSVHERDGEVVVLVDGLQEGEQYGIYLTAGGTTVQSLNAPSATGKILSAPIEVPETVDELQLVRPNGELSAEPLGTPILRATPPSG